MGLVFPHLMLIAKVKVPGQCIDCSLQSVADQYNQS
jgi:hypothetical protein